MAMTTVPTWICFNIKEEQLLHNSLTFILYTQMQTKLIILFIFAYLAVIGFATPLPKPILGVLNGLLSGSSGVSSTPSKPGEGSPSSQGLLGGELLGGLLG